MRPLGIVTCQTQVADDFTMTAIPEAHLTRTQRFDLGRTGRMHGFHILLFIHFRKLRIRTPCFASDHSHRNRIGRYSSSCGTISPFLFDPYGKVLDRSMQARSSLRSTFF